ncbi:calycin-like domain-containing protein [Prevotellamassilia timonensis]|uniref:calycin-like domain-containing protein n=1 Tax=Prevotellamassilia timonensis TaxID=1852370 RepID=UPI00307A44D8
MKKQLLTLALLAVAGTAGAQYQLPNGNFEGGYTDNVTIGGNNGNQVPNNWHWFHDKTGSIDASTVAMSAMHNYVVTDGNNHYVKLVQGSMGGNGNLTTGIINAGNSLAKRDGGKSNYNWSDPTGKGENTTKVPTDRSGQNEGKSAAGQTFSGKPDAVKFKYAAYLKNASQRIQLRVVVHGEGRYRDPEYSKDNYDDIKWGVATFNDTRTLSSKSDKVVLKEAQAEFVAGINQSSITPAAVLVSLTTNEKPGVGDQGNFACFDDIEFVYYHALSSATYDGQAIANFDENTLSYDLSSQVYDENKFACTVKGVGAEAVKSYDEATGLLTVTVNGNNISADATSKTVYTFQFKNKDYTGVLSALSVNGEKIEAFAEDSYHYTVVGDYTHDCVKYTTKGADDAVTTNYDAATRICSINVVGGTEENTYFVKFAKATTDYKGKMSIVMGEPLDLLSAATSTVGITTPVDGKADFQLLGFELGGDPIGDIFVTDVPYTEEDGVVNLYKEQTITIFGDNGANLGPLPVVLKGTLKDGKLTANIGIAPVGVTVDIVPLDATSLDFSSNAVDLEGTPLADMKADMTNSNMTIFLPEGTEGVDAKESNVVVGTTASSLSLADGNDWGVTKDFTATAVSYDRAFNTEDNYVQSFVLPFGFTVPTGTTVAELSSVNGDNLVFKPVKETVANKPYLVVTTDADFINKLTNVQVKATTGADLTTTVDGVSHIGSYTAQNVANVYGYTNGKFVKANNGSVKPFRTYIKVAEGTQTAPMAFGVNIEGTVTGINNATTAATAKEAIYNLQGVRVSGDLKHLTKGVYIVNGQKVVVK